eukprot:4133987-Heterocapsa_arctica.AAC.1
MHATRQSDQGPSQPAHESTPILVRHGLRVVAVLEGDHLHGSRADKQQRVEDGADCPNILGILEAHADQAMQAHHKRLEQVAIGVHCIMAPAML